MNGHRRGSASLILGLIALFTVVSVTPVFSQSGKNAIDRKLITRVSPEYPDALKKNFIGGAVRVEVTVSPAGNVDNAQLLGGNPILGQAAIKAIKQWKYAPAGTWDKLVVKVDFDPRTN
ncbi:MAG TPA: energy transducer TonB [Terriglobales bacterium]|nr:energy transducer TonB [Terriglobales bacterium]